MKFNSTLRKIFLSFSIFTALLTSAQEIPVTLKVIGPKKEPIAFASITVINRTDSTQHNTKSADSSGIAKFKLSKGQYTVRISSVNYQSLEKGISISGNQSFFSFTAEPIGKMLSDVVVTSKKPLIRQEDDKTIVDPEPIIGTSTSGYEVIEKTPGLFVDQDGNIYISSLSPAQVYINNRELKMSASDVATILKSLPPNAISKIEILRTPSAKYDANSSGGIVNVVLRKGVKIGMTGSIYGGLQQGVYGNKFTGISLNNNDGEKSSSLNMNYSRRDTYERIKTDRFFGDTILSQNAKTRYPSNNYFIGYSYNFSPSKKWETELSTSLSLNDYKNKTKNPSLITKTNTSQTVAQNLNQISNDGTSLNFRSAIDGTLKIDSLGSEWENDIFFNYSHYKYDQVFSTNYFSPITYMTGGDGNSENKREHLNMQSDLKLKWKKKFTFESGGKVSIMNYNSVTDYFKESNGLREKDKSRTNTFEYTENINALYVQGAKTLGKDFIIKFGTRLENTNMKGHQVIPSDTTFSIHRTDLFPYLFLSKNLMKIAGYDLRAYLVYRRTISRPSYEQLNPFPRYVDQYLSERGNPSLHPQFTNNYEANISVDERPILAVGVNDTRDIFTQVVHQEDTSRSQTFRTYDNLGKNKEWYFRGLGAIPPGGKYFFVLGVQYNHNFYQGSYENGPLSYKRGSWTLFTYHMLKLDKRSVFTLNGYMRLKGQQGLYELSSFGALNASINRQFLKQKLTITLSANDIFLTNKNEFTHNQGSVHASGVRGGDTRRVGLNIRYNFGIRKKEDNNDFNVDPEKTN